LLGIHRAPSPKALLQQAYAKTASDDSADGTAVSAFDRQPYFGVWVSIEFMQIPLCKEPLPSA
jgi:hypothetical protein